MWLLFVVFGTVNCILYDSFSGKPASRSQIKRFEDANTTKYCTNQIIQPCDPDEWRRIDGSCNNLKHPQRGAIHTPSYRVLPPVYGADFTDRKSKHGEELPLPRVVRYENLKEGKAASDKFTQLGVNYIVFLLNDIGTLKDILNFLSRKTYCCEPKGKTDHECTPILIPDFDPVHRFSNVRCMNLTRPFTFQYYQCRDNSTTPARLLPSTPLFDLSNIYNLNNNAINTLRTYVKGKIKVEVENGKLYPPSGGNICFQNHRPQETRCNAFHPNGVITSNLFHVWFYRLHNHIASILDKLNPCWDDNRLFYSARDITIAISLEIYFYELLPLFLGKSNLVRDGIISSSKGFRDSYKECLIPKMSDEYEYTLRWFHIAQESTIEMYDKDGYILRTYPIVNLTARTGFIPNDDNEGQMARGSYRQASARFMDHTVDPDISEIALREMQYAFDVTAADIAKGRLFGFAPYIKYREFCGKKTYKTFEDLSDVMSKERILRLKKIYQHVEDIDLMAGMWSERRIKGGNVPHTVYCLLTEQLLRSVRTDRHWYERHNRPHAFTYDQLQTIRKVSVAWLMCVTAHGVDKIQPRAFLKPGPKNKIASCDQIETFNFDAFAAC